MRHAVYGRKLSRTKNERRRLFAGLIRDLFKQNGITTTLAKAKTIQPMVDKLIGKAKLGTDVARRQIMAEVPDKAVARQLFDEAKTRFASRTSGYTRIIKLGKRRGDATDVAILSFVDERVTTEVIAPVKAEKPQKEVKKVEKTVKESKTKKAETKKPKVSAAKKK